MAHNIHCMIYKLQDIFHNTNKAPLKEKLRLQNIAIENLERLNNYMEDRLSTPWQLIDTKLKHKQWKRAFKMQGANHARITRWMTKYREWMDEKYKRNFLEWQESGMMENFHLEDVDDKKGGLKIEEKEIGGVDERNIVLKLKLKQNELLIYELTKTNHKLWVMEVEERAFLLRKEYRGEYLSEQLWGLDNLKWYLARVRE